MRILGIETSCDETAAAVVTDDGRVLSDVVHSQIAIHAPWGGVVPELAARDHLTNLRPVVTRALEAAGVTLEDLGGIAVTTRPGLTGALLVGMEFASGLALAAGLPVVGVDHLIGHVSAPWLKHPGAEAEPPADGAFVALLVSGGHTALYRVDALEESGIRELGATRDDAVGEAYDKVAKLLGLGYPGGPILDRLAAGGDPRAFPIAPPMSRWDSLEFSFSGIKTSVARWVEQHGRPATEQGLRDLAASFQHRVVGTLVKRALEAARREGVGTIVIGGGVAANRELRARLARACEKRELRLVAPPPASCTDNAAMIALAGAP
ncbi:MAG: tRNA (adenosine(37)-N6)-threonylcarbamoyltransferase complex transferase subunit TsaD, partial [Deltaproteobacteria bacterium]|nr:tRNA (adenosine(37)-N6)-threonylcarbamoyltransferase complex transferase subunit TsaD [Deltaproteobacteria bacterium]